MFKKIFTELCKKHNEAPTNVCLKIGLSNAAYSQWTDESIPRRTTLESIAKYFNVSIEYLLGKEQASGVNNDLITSLTEKEIIIIKKYRQAAKSVQDGIDTLLEINSAPNVVDDMIETINAHTNVPTKAK